MTVPGADLAVDLPRYRAHHPTVMNEKDVAPAWRRLTFLRTLHGARQKRSPCAATKPRLFSGDLLIHFGDRGTLWTSSSAPKTCRAPKPAPDRDSDGRWRASACRRPASLYVGDMVRRYRNRSRRRRHRLDRCRTGSDTLENAHRPPKTRSAARKPRGDSRHSLARIIHREGRQERKRKGESSISFEMGNMH